MRVEIEKAFGTVVKRLGGNLVSELIANVNPPKNADYAFHSPLVIAELKCIEHEVFGAEYNTKMQRLFDSWMERGLFLAYGKVRIALKTLPKQCQREWSKVLQTPLQRDLLSAANTQIRETKKTLGAHKAQGVLVIANDGNSSLQPSDFHILLCNVLRKKKENGQPLFSHINWVVYFSANVPVHIPELGESMPLWVTLQRGTSDEPEMDRFLATLREAWMSYCAELRGEPVTDSFEMKMDSLPTMQYVRPLIGKFYADSAGRKYKCLGLEGLLVRWMLLDSHQHGHEIDAEFTQKLVYAGNYSPMSDVQEINRLEERYRSLTRESA